VSFLMTVLVAVKALRRNALRTALTALGMIIGVAAVIVMVAIGTGARASIEQQIRSTGSNVITVNAGGGGFGPVRQGQGAITTLTDEDARAIELEDSNLFALSRFPGYDRWEDSSRVTYGFDWAYDRPKLSIMTTIGQSYRLNNRSSIFPDGTGLADRVSDIVGRTRVRYGRFIDLTHRFRIDKDNLAFRRNEIDLTLGGEQTYIQLGYLRLNRDIDEAVEDLRDKEELRAAARIKFAKHWSVFGATVLDLTDESEDPLSVSDGFEPVRHRLSIDYEDECIALGVSWRRDYERIGGFRDGSTFSFRVSLKGLGR